MDKDWILFLRKKYGLTCLEMEEYIVSFNYLNNGKPVTPQLLVLLMKVFQEEKLLEWDAVSIIETINKSVRPKEKLPPELDLYSYLLFIIPITRKTHRQRMKIKQLFSYFDTNKDGKISTDEFYDALLRMCKPMPPENYRKYKEKIKRLIKKADDDHNGFLDEKEFNKFIKSNKLL
jgi:Ca2+-binding EF-hand superfamily protein